MTVECPGDPERSLCTDLGTAQWRHEHVLPVRPRAAPASPLRLEFPQSLAVYDDYAAAQKTVDFLSDEEFPVENCLIVGTDLKRIERITGRLTTGRVAVGGLPRGCGSGCSSACSSRCSPTRAASRTIVLDMLFGAASSG